MDVAQLGGHVFARDQIAGVGGALASTSGLGLNHDPVTLAGGFRGAGGRSDAVNALGGGVPVAWSAVRGNRCNKRGAGLNGVAGA